VLQIEDKDRRLIGAALQLAVMTLDAEIQAFATDQNADQQRRQSAERLSAQFKDLIRRLAGRVIEKAPAATVSQGQVEGE
jgi:hypothetical protein